LIPAVIAIMTYAGKRYGWNSGGSYNQILIFSERIK